MVIKSSSKLKLGSNLLFVPDSHQCCNKVGEEGGLVKKNRNLEPSTNSLLLNRGSTISPLKMSIT